MVKTREAAQNPKLDRIAFPNHAANAIVTEKADGDLSATAAGREVFSAPAPKMWDSSGIEVTSSELVGSPGAGGRVATMDVEVSGSSVAVTPNVSMFDDPATVFPVYIDPSYLCTSCGRNHYAVLYKTGLTEYDTDDLLRSGYVWDTQNSKYVTARSYVEMSTNGLAGKVIKEANLNFAVNNAYSCGGSTQVWLTTQFTAATKYGSEPGRHYQLGTIGSYGGCPGAGTAPIEMRSTVQVAADQGWTAFYVGLWSPDDSVLNTHWRRFGTNPSLVVRYNSYPEKPSDLSTRHGLKDYACVTGAGRPYIATTTPKLRARLKDPDNSGLLNARFYWSTGGNSVGSEGTSNIQPGSMAEISVPAGSLVDGQVYSWHVVAGDDELLSPQSDSCEFGVDVTPPAVSSVSSTDYPENGLAGAAGKSGLFTFGPNGTADVASYVYTVDGTDPTTLGSPSVNATGTGATTTALITPIEGTNTVKVASVDRAGNRGPVKSYVFRANPPTAPIGSWKMDSTLSDSAAGARHLSYTGTGSASYVSGYTANAFRMNAATSDAAASASSIVRTDRGFSVAAWVRLDAAQGWRAVVSQEGPLSAAFTLQRCDDTGKWCFVTSPGDAANPAWASIHSQSSALAGVWTHVAGVYDAGTKQIHIYVNGRLEGSKAAEVGNISGRLIVGRGKQNGAYVCQFAGQVDDVRLWDRSTSAAEVAAAANASVLRARYKLDEGSGTTTRDEVTGGNAALSGGTQWSEDAEDPSIMSARFPESPVGDITGTRPASLQSGGSLTLSAWVKLDSATGFRTIASIDGQRSSRAALQYCGDRQKWCFGVSPTDVDTPTWTTAYSDVAVVVGQWVYLTGIYDAATGRVHLIVDANSSSAVSATGQSVTNGTDGVIAVGRAKQYAVGLAYFAGSIDDVRVYSGVRSAADIDADRRARELGA
ncbi:LamG domain-containing protein [Actinokineospora sp.]|uniref:LamG domain-containing protein n=1 Tax=Actinokineospora sp. TaxID=1872133 RepID=UPI003D6C5226